LLSAAVPSDKAERRPWAKGGAPNDARDDGTTIMVTGQDDEVLDTTGLLDAGEQ
jgi:hypothetical protein